MYIAVEGWERPNIALLEFQPSPMHSRETLFNLWYNNRLRPRRLIFIEHNKPSRVILVESGI